MIGLIVGVIGALLTVYASEAIGKIMFLVGSLSVFVGIFLTLIFAFLPVAKSSSDDSQKPSGEKVQ